METEVKNSELVTASIAWSESEGEEMVEETDGLRNVGFKPNTLSRTENIAAPKNVCARVLINEKGIKTESLLYGLS